MRKKDILYALQAKLLYAWCRVTSQNKYNAAIRLWSQATATERFALIQDWYDEKEGMEE